jgi:assimilatory nitrate reductase catalytic subunit
LSGIDGYRMLDAEGGVQWPFPEGAKLATPDQHQRRLFADGRFFHADGNARFLFEAPRPLPEPTTASHPFTLLTGRGASSQWHTQTRTKKSALLRRLAPAQIYVELNPVDARRLGVRPRQWVWVVSQRGRVKARAVVTPTVRSGQVFMPMHYATTNQLTFPAFDPYSRQPAYKHCAVDVVIATE